MNSIREERVLHQETDQPILRYGYMLILFFLALSGFGQMPIFKRYYISDIPGLGWLAKFFVTHYIHYVGAILLLALFAYILAMYLLLDRKRRTVTISGYIRGGLLGTIIMTGIFLVIRNLERIWLPPGFIVFLDVMHLGFVMAFLMVALYCLIFRKHWTQHH